MSRLIIALARECTYVIAKTSGNKEDKKWLGGTRPLPEQIFLGAKRRKRAVRSSTLLWGLRRVSYLLTFATATKRRDRSGKKKKSLRPAETFFHARILEWKIQEEIEASERNVDSTRNIA